MSKKKKIEGVYVDEQLTARNKAILMSAMKARNEGRIKFVWVKEGKIFIRRSEESRAEKMAEIFEFDDMQSSEGGDSEHEEASGTKAGGSFEGEINHGSKNQSSDRTKTRSNKTVKNMKQQNFVDSVRKMQTRNRK